MAFPTKVEFQLPGWALVVAKLQATGEGKAELARRRRAVAEYLRDSTSLAKLPRIPRVAAMRELFRRAGCDPTRWPPSSEALARRLLRGEELPAISPLVDLGNCVSVELLLPVSVLAADAVGSSWVLRAGAEGEHMLSLRGPMSLAGKPLLADEYGPFSTPITDARRVAVRRRTREALLIIYYPAILLENDRDYLTTAAGFALYTAFLRWEIPVAERDTFEFFPLKA